MQAQITSVIELSLLQCNIVSYSRLHLQRLPLRLRSKRERDEQKSNSACIHCYLWLLLEFNVRMESWKELPQIRVEISVFVRPCVDQATCWTLRHVELQQARFFRVLSNVNQCASNFLCPVIHSSSMSATQLAGLYSASACNNFSLHPCLLYRQRALLGTPGFCNLQ